MARDLLLECLGDDMSIFEKKKKISNRLLRKFFRAVPLVAAISISGCANDGGVAGHKADYNNCELREVLAVINDGSTTADSLAASLAGLRGASRVAANIISHRNGADGTFGTSDDNPVDDYAELDSISRVGPAALSRLSEGLAGSCGGIDGRPLIDSTTFAGQSGSFPRTGTEIEAAYTLSGIDGAELRQIMRTPRGNGDVFENVRENNALAAFTYGYETDEVPWDSRTNNYRADLKYVALTIEDGRFDPDARTGEREISLGTDIMDDIYFDTEDLDLAHRQMVMRARARWDNATTIRRILIASKSGVSVDDLGIKSAAKIDVRNDGASQAEIDAMPNDVMSGISTWYGSSLPLEPVRAVYEALRDDGALKDIAGRTGVLKLDPMAHLRGTRSRLHYNEASIQDIRRFSDLGARRLAESVTAAEAKIASGATAAETRSLQALIDIGQGIADSSLVLTRVNDALRAAGLSTMRAATLDSALDFGGFSNLDDFARHRVVAETLEALYEEASEALDDVDRILSGADDNDNDAFAFQFVEWTRSQDQTVGRKTEMDPYLERFDAMVGNAAQLAEFNAFGVAERADGNDDFEGFSELSAAEFEALRPYLDLERIKIHQQQIALTGVLANALFFDEARAYFIPNTWRNTGNFIIDTTDLSEMVSHEDWEGMSDAQKRIDAILPADRVYHASLTNEVQIELGLEGPFVERIKELNDQIAAGNAGPDAQAMLDGATFVFNTYREALGTIAQIKGRRIERALRRGGVRGADWGPAERSKGEVAILTLAGEL